MSLGHAPLLADIKNCSQNEHDCIGLNIINIIEYKNDYLKKRIGVVPMNIYIL